MVSAKNIKPISYVKANASKIVHQLNDGNSPIYITQNGEVKAVLMDVKEYEQNQDSLIMLQLIAQSEKQFAQGKYKSEQEAFAEIEKHIDQL